MRRIVLLGLVVATALVAVSASSAIGAGGGKNGNAFTAKLIGYEEVASISTVGRGQFHARLDGTTLRYTLSFRGLEGGNTLFAHIHFGQPGVNGGVSAFLCGGSPPASDKPACPNGGGTIEGTIDAADVIGPSTQGIAAGELHELVEAMRKGFAYANVHTTTYGGGEIRGQISFRGRHKGRGHDD
jgi:hypothetical protein